MGMVMNFKKKPFIERVIHKLFHCPTFWKLRPAFKCPGCHKTYRCYWDGNDVTGYGIDYCSKCAKYLEGVTL